MKRLITPQLHYSIAALAAIALSFNGCNGTFTLPSTEPGPPPVYADAHDPIVINAEKTLAIARDTFDLFVHLERDHEAQLRQASPEFHKYAEFIRRNGIKYLRSANETKNAYKHNRTAENKANLTSALALVSEALNQTKKYINQTGLTGP